MFTDPSYYWFTAGILFLVIEVFTLSVILLFIGLAAITSGAALFFNIVSDDQIIVQLAIFLGSIILWYLALSIPIKKIKALKSKNNYHSILNQKAQTVTVLEKSKIGKVTWSGTRMKAVLSKNNINQKIDKNQPVRIVALEEDNTLVVTDNKN